MVFIVKLWFALDESAVRLLTSLSMKSERIKSIIKTFTVEELEKMYRGREEDELFFYVGFAALPPHQRKSHNIKALAVSKGYEVLMRAHGRPVKELEGDVFTHLDELIEELKERFNRWFCERCGELVKGEVRRHRGEQICTDCFFGR